MHDPTSGREAPVSIFEEIRRQMEEMLGGHRPVGPHVLPPSPAASRRAGAPEGPGAGMVAATVGAYWLLAIAAARRRRRAGRNRPTPGSGGA